MDLTFFHNIFFDFFTALLVLIFIGLTYIATVRNVPEHYESYDELSVLVVIPCRGLDYSLEENLKSIAMQDYPKFKALTIVDSPDDAAVPAIKKAGMEFMFSREVCSECSGKVKAIASAVQQNPGFDAYVIADSDILVERNWLSSLLSPLKSEEYGISTTFPYFDPIGGFWSKVKLIWGFVGLGMMESKLTRFGWGGSLAFRGTLLENGGMDFFKGYVSDDIALTKLCKNHGLKIAYVREAMPKINSPDDFPTFMEWANRQTALSIYSTRNVFYYGILLYGASILLFVSSLLLSLFASPIFLLFLIPTIINASRSVKRAQKMPFTAFFISFLIPFVYFYNLAKAARMDKISWRGRDYSLEE